MFKYPIRKQKKGKGGIKKVEQIESKMADLNPNQSKIILKVNHLNRSIRKAEIINIFKKKV